MIRRGPLPYPTPLSAPTSQPIRATCVDAPLGARRIVVRGAARRRVLTCVDAPLGARRIVVWGAARRRVLTCVDAPLGARRIVVRGAARRRVLTCVRPLMRRVSCRGPVREFADRVQIKAAYSWYGVAHWFSRPRLSTVAPYPSSDLPT